MHSNILCFRQSIYLRPIGYMIQHGSLQPAQQTTCDSIPLEMTTCHLVVYCHICWSVVNKRRMYDECRRVRTCVQRRGRSSVVRKVGDGMCSVVTCIAEPWQLGLRAMSKAVKSRLATQVDITQKPAAFTVALSSDIRRKLRSAWYAP